MRPQLDLDPEMVEALDNLNVHGYAAYAMARDLVAQKQQQAQVGGRALRVCASVCAPETCKGTVRVCA